MTDTTNMDFYEASASDCLTTQPPLLNSRKPHHRKLRSRNSPHYHRRHTSWRNRRTARIRDSDHPELSSSDEFHPPNHLTPSGLPNPHFLPYMPRPSDIVPAIDEGSAPDAGFDREARQIHKRRVDATRIMLASLGPKGNLVPVPHWKRNRSGLSKYTIYMAPPREDNNLPDLRVPPPLLSRFYRGSLLAVHRVGTPAKTPKSERPSTASPEASAFECEYLGSSSRSDFDVTEPRTVAKNEPEEIVAHDAAPASPVEDPTEETGGFSKAAFLEELEMVAGGSSDGLSDGEIERIGEKGGNKGNGASDSDREREAKVPAKPKRPSVSTASNPVQVQEISVPEKKSEIDLLREMLSQNPELLFVEKKQLEEVHVEKTVVAEEGAAEGEGEDDSNLTQFEKEKRIARMFSHSTTKRPRYTSKDMAAMYVNPSKRRKYGAELGDGDGANGNAATDSRMNLKFTMKLMNKMGFKGRLGKKEDGRKDPVLPTRHSFRSGLGSRPAQVPARIGDQSLLPTTFTGKAVKNGMPAGSSSTLDATASKIGANGVVPSKTNGTVGSGDVYTRRRKGNASAVERETQPGRDLTSPGLQNGTTETVEKTNTRQLDDNDIYETDEDNNTSVDNSRRAILIDFDVLIKDSAKRRLDAIEKVVADASLIINVKKLSAKEPRDLCDGDLLRKVLGNADVKPHDMDGFEEKLDEAFEGLPEPKLDLELLDMLRQYSKDVHFGIFHHGSRRRMRHELEATGLAKSFLQEVCATVKHEEKWPYIDTWQDLTCRVGVRPRQCLYVLNEARQVKRKEDRRPSAGVVAGACLGAQTAVWAKVEDGVKLYIRGAMQKDREIRINNSSAYSDRKKVLDELLKDRMPALKRRRVLALYEEDMLWYSAVVQYEGVKGGKCWIKFNKFENTEWVHSEELVSLCRKDFRKMKKMEFPGLLDSDASVL